MRKKGRSLPPLFCFVMSSILILNGPNLNVLHVRERTIYPSIPFDAIFQWLQGAFPSFHLLHFQSNHEGALIDRIHQLLSEPVDGLVINPGAYTHTSIALRDALAILSIPKVEVHLSQIYAREPYRRHSYISEVCHATITGCGKYSYYLALLYLQKLLSDED